MKRRRLRTWFLGETCCWCGRFRVLGRWIGPNRPVLQYWLSWTWDKVRYLVVPTHGICPDCTARLKAEQRTIGKALELTHLGWQAACEAGFAGER